MCNWPTLLKFSLTLLILFITGCTLIQPSPVIQEKPTTDTITYPSTSSCTYHVVERGETLAGIATRCGLNYKDIARWNKIDPPYVISQGQTLVLYGPPATDNTTIPTPSSNSKEEETTTLGGSKKEDYYTVAPGDTLFNIAKRHNCTVADLRAWNQLTSDSLTVGQRLKISGLATTSPTTSLSPTQQATKDTGKPHVVAHGETLYSIAKSYGYSAADIAAWNNLQPPYNLTIGQVLIVNPPAFVTASPKVFSDNPGYHTVTQGDTLYNIAKRYGRTVEELKKWNNLQNNEPLSLGQRLRVSSASAEMPAASLSPPSINTLQHEVRKGETMYSIATKYGVTAPELAQLNGIGPPYTVYPGQRLTVIPKH